MFPVNCFIISPEPKKVLEASERDLFVRFDYREEGTGKIGRGTVRVTSVEEIPIFDDGPWSVIGTINILGVWYNFCAFYLSLDHPNGWMTISV
jgi:hypothetical protein